jgi:hypothetical protein
VQEFYYLFVVCLTPIVSQNMLKFGIYADMKVVQQPLINELWQQKRKLSPVGFEVFPLENVKVNAFDEINLIKPIYFSLFKVKLDSTVILRDWWDRVDVLNEFLRMLTTFLRSYTGKETEIP